MPTLANPFRAPADGLKTRPFRALAAAITWLLWPVIGCRHRRITLPYNNRQTCLECGATRIYQLDFDFAHADAGTFIGPWKKHTHPSQDAHRVIARTLIAKALRAGSAVR